MGRAGLDLWQRFAHGFVPERLEQNPELARRARTAVAAALVPIPFALTFAISYQYTLPTETGNFLSLLVLGTIPVSLVALAVLRRTGSLASTVNLLMGYAFLAFLVIAHELGGATASARYWLIILPTGAMLVAGWRLALLWFALCIASCVGFYAADAWGYVFPARATSHQLERIWVNSVAGLTVLTVAFASVFDRFKGESLATLRWANMALARARDDADAANRSKSGFLANVSHEIRTPMTAILGFTDLLMERCREVNATPEQTSALETIKRNGEHLLEIINDILDLSKIEAGHFEIERERFSPVQVVNEVVSLMRVRARDNQLDLRVEYENEIPESIHGDPTRLKQILVNLVGNAIKFTSGGRVTVGLALLRDREEPRIRFDVIDTGIGLSPEQINRLFQPFSQADASTSRLYGGTGLGLSICRRLCEMMGGAIGVDSEVGDGSRFWVELPTGELGTLHRPTAPEPGADSSEMLCALPYRILVADDLADNRQLLDEMLTAAGAVVELACDGLQAVELAEQAAARNAPFDVVLMDIQMPNLDGYGALEALRELGFEQPIIALTAHAMDADRERCETAGFDDHACKPIRRAELLAAISSQAEGRAPLAAARRRPTGSFSASAAQEPDPIGLWERLVRLCLPAEQHDSKEARRQAALVLAVALAPLPAIPVWAALLAKVQPDGMAGPFVTLILLSAPLLLALPVSLRLLGSTTTATHGLLAYGVVLFSLLTFCSGGPLSPFSYWNLLIPMVALPLVGAHAAAGWTLLCVAQTYGFYFLQKSGVELPDVLLPGHGSLLSLIGISTLMTLSTALVLIFERAKDEAIRTLAQANEALGIARDAADQANRTKSEFLANISHEIRTPMTAIFGYSEMLVEEWNEEEAPGSMIRAVTTIQRNGQHLLGLINELLDLSKIEAGRLEVEHIRFSPGRLVLDVVALMQVRAQEKGLDLVCEFRTPIPEQIEGDPTRLRQVLLNLVGNAIKFTDHGRVALEVALIRSEEDSRLRFAVRDTGIGIRPDDLAGLFQPFQRGDAQVARAYGGTGLGLAISRNLCELMGGEIAVESEPGVGSCFRLGLPTGDLAGVRLVDDPAIPEADLEAGGDLDYSILLAEDGPDNQRLIAHMLRRVGMSVDIAENGQVAVEKVLASLDADAPYDAVLMDMQMPVLDGYRASAALRERGYTGPIIALTAHAVADERTRCLAAGCDEFANKPIERRRLIAAIRHWVRTRKAEG